MKAGCQIIEEFGAEWGKKKKSPVEALVWRTCDGRQVALDDY